MMLEKKYRIKLLAIILFILSLGPISWIVYGNEVKKINYSIQEEIVEDNTKANLVLTIVSSDEVKEVTKIILPDGTEVEKQTNITYQVEANGEYEFIVFFIELEDNGNGEVVEVERKESICYQEINIIEKTNNVREEILQATEPKEIPQEASDLQKESAIESVGVDIIIDENNFPDTNFRNWLLNPININGYGVDAILNYNELSNITAIGVNSSNIKSLKGVEYFFALKSLLCVNNQITELDVSKITGLEYLYCGANQLTTLDITQNKSLVDLRCNGNNITELNISQNVALGDLVCGDNQLSALDISKNPLLFRIDCSGNRLTTINLSNQSKLRTVTMNRQKIEISMGYSSGLWKSANTKKYVLDSIVSNNIIYNKSLGQFNASNTNDKAVSFSTNCIDAIGSTYAITGTLDFTYEGIELNATNFPDVTFRNWLLDIKNIHGYGNDRVLTTDEISNIKEIDIRNNGITDIKGIEYFSALETLHCQQNKLTKIDLTKNLELVYINCSSNNLTSLDLTNQTKLVELEAANQELEIEMNYNNNQWQSNAIYDISQIDVSTIQYNASMKQFLSVDSNTSSASFTTNCQDGNGIVHTVLGVLRFQYQGIEINEMNFPDAIFRDWLLDSANINSYGEDGVITYSEVQNITSIDVNSKGISDLKGIEYFTSLTFLNCYGNNLTTIDISKNTALIEIHCYSNQLKSLNVSKNLALERLHCVSNQLSTLDVSNNGALEYFYCSNNKLTEIDVSKNLVLKDLRCDMNLLKELNISQNTSLTCLICSDNKLTRLDVSKNPELLRLYCEKNQLTTLNLSKQYKLLDVSIDQQKITVPLYYKDNLWQSNTTNKYILDNISTNNVSYNTALGQFSTTNTITKSTTFTTNCLDNKGTNHVLTGIIEFAYNGFVPVTSITDVPKLIKVGEQLNLTCNIEPTDATEKNVVWSIKNDGGTGAIITNNNLVITSPGIVEVTATIYGGKTTGDYVQNFKIITLKEPASLISIPSSITLEKVKDNEAFEAIKEENISILSSTDTGVYSDNFYVRTDPILHLIHTNNTDEWFTAQVYDKSDTMYTSKDVPLAILNATTIEEKFFIKIYKDITRQEGVYKGTMNFVIGYGTSQ